MTAPENPIPEFIRLTAEQRAASWRRYVDQRAAKKRNAEHETATAKAKDLAS